MDERESRPGMSPTEWRTFWISLAANAVLFLAIVELHRMKVRT